MADIQQTYAVDELADFVVGANPTDLSERVLTTLKRNVLDSIACAIGALDGELIPAIRAHAEQFSSRPTATSSAADARRLIRPPSSTRCWCAIPIYSIPI